MDLGEGWRRRRTGWAEENLTGGANDEAAAMRASPPSGPVAWRGTAVHVEQSAPSTWTSDSERTEEVRR
jgi:hypothetical protein